MRPQEPHPGIERQQLLDGRVVDVSLEEQIAVRGQLRDALDDRRARVGDTQMELADAPIDPALEPLLDVSRYAGVPVPAPHVAARAIRPEEGDDGLRSLLVELQRAVVG